MNKIAIIDNDITILGGVEKVTEQLANKLSDKYDVIIISLHKENKEIPYKFNNKIKVIFSTTKKFNRIRESIKNNSKRLKKILKDENVKLAICMGHYTTFISLVCKKCLKTKIINCDHGSLINQYGDKATVFIRRFNYLFSTHSVLLTKRNYDDYVKLFHARKSKMSVIYNSISSKLIFDGKKNNYNIKTNKIITVGRMTPEKGFDMLVQIAKRLNEITDIDWQWDVYGDGPLKNEIQSDIEKNNLSKRVILKGQNNDVVKLFNNYAMYVLTSYREGLPIALLEAKVNKLPIVSFNVNTGPSEIVDNDKNGYLVDMYDIDMMAEKIKYLLENRKIRKEFSDESYEGLDKFSEERINREWITLIDKIKKE